MRLIKLAAQNRNVGLLKVLLDAKVTPNYYYAGLQIAVRQDDPVMVRLLLDAGADPAFNWPSGLEYSPPDDSPLLLALSVDNFALFELFLNGVDSERRERRY